MSAPSRPDGGATGGPEVTVTVQVSGTYADIAPVLADLSRLFGEHRVQVVGRPSRDAWWDPERAARFVAELRTPALVALRHIATGAPKVGVAHVKAQMARDGLPLTPGTLSSIGFAVRRLGCPPPFVRDGYQGAYVMDPAVATHLLGALESEEGRRAATGTAHPGRGAKRRGTRGR